MDSSFLPNKIRYDAAEEETRINVELTDGKRSYYQILRDVSALRASLLTEGLLNKDSVESLHNMVVSKKLGMELSVYYTNYLTSAGELVDCLVETTHSIGVSAAPDVYLVNFLADEATRFHSQICSLHGGPKLMTASSNLLESIKDGKDMQATVKEVKSAFTQLNAMLMKYFLLGAELGLPIQP